MDHPELTNRFLYHAPTTSERARAHQLVRNYCASVAFRLDELVPDGREKSTAITKLEEAMFWANAAIARQAGDPDFTAMAKQTQDEAHEANSTCEGGCPVESTPADDPVPDSVTAAA